MNPAAAAGAAPLSGSYWVERPRLLAGSYPGHADPEAACARLEALLDAGIDWILDLTAADELPTYAPLLAELADARDRPPPVVLRRPIRDHGLPRSAAEMAAILDELEAALAAGRRVYVHCRAGIGRTGTLIGCYLARRLGDGETALARLDELWVAAGRDADWPTVPETEAQRRFVSDWRDAARPRAAGEADVLRDRCRGLWWGLALGDALAVPVQHRRPGTFTPVGDLLGGGPYELPRGAWSDDTSIALQLAESLLERGVFDARDFVARLTRWRRDGEGSATGQCVGISAATARALSQAAWSGNPFAGSHDPARAEAEPLVRAGVAAAFLLDDPERAVELAAEVARPTHQAPVVLDACRLAAALVVGVLQGRPRTELLAPGFSPVEGLWRRRPLRREVAALAAGGWRAAEEGSRPAALDALAVALRALADGRGYRDTVLAAVNQGLDADVQGALTGQLAGALYGAASLPKAWVASLADAPRIATVADRLLTGALQRLAAI
ncbi:MAG: ADP-ribosylglycohydrolase family protein [Proteobacteria bacterium]|nr:ADP-ribosylglycohydrolase family protein [Pseudomonadota bacterium]